MRSASGGPGSESAASGCSLLVERAASALAHEAKNPLHNMALHLQLVSEKLPGDAARGVDRHLQAMRDGIAQVDALLKAFADLAAPANLVPDLGQALTRALLLFSFEARRKSVELTRKGPAEVRVAAPGEAVLEIVCNAVLAGIALAREGRLTLAIEPDGQRVRLEVIADGGVPRREETLPHLEAVRRLSSVAAAEPSIDVEGAGPARLSLSFAHTR
ncbi:MAG: HAMP domain-containing histidine kinase [Deltaproteobacteria bacterium]|nr:MAG: HAMP domain-containing histidine kinase [Deltaproteobacteria bacterium]